MESEDSDQTGRMPRLILVISGCTCHFVGFVMHWLNFLPEMQDCVIRDGTTGLWHDVYCDEPYMAVCEIPAESGIAVKILKIWTPKIAVIILKFKPFDINKC